MTIEAAELDALLAVAVAAAGSAAAQATAWQTRRDALEVEEKAASDDLVSQADRDAEAAAHEMIAARRPRDGFLGEESQSVSGETGVRWLVDPIDGTTNYLYGRPDWAVSVAAISEDDGRILVGAVLEPALGRCATARWGGGAWSAGRRLHCSPTRDLSRALIEINFGRPAQRAAAGATVDRLIGHVRDVRRGGSAASALAQVADGRAEGYWGPGLAPWDAAAGVLLVEEAGGMAGDLTGPTDGRWPASGDVLAAAPGLWEPLRDRVRGEA